MNPRWQSAAFDAGMYVPRTWWSEKPYTYAVYFTCYALDMPVHQLYWGLTTTIFDEAIAATGWIGMLLGPLFLGVLCRLADLSRNSILRILGTLICLLFMATNMPSFMPLFILWIVGLSWESHRNFFSLRLSRYDPGSPS